MTEKPAKGMTGFLLYNPFADRHFFRVYGEVDPVTGMVCNLGDLDGFVRREIVDRFDQQNLNLDGSFETIVPTTENLCVEIYGAIRAGFRHAKLE